MTIEYMFGVYDYRLATLSILVAVLASYAALDLVDRVRAAKSRDAHAWLIAGAVAMGTGVWSMHFIAMLAFDLPIEMGYDFGITLVSWLLAVTGSAIALRVASRAQLGWRRLIVGAAFMAASIAGMHYLGMAAMRMQPGIVYAPVWVVVSLLIAFGACAAAMWVAFHLRAARRLRGFMRKLGAALIMGAAIVGMHYTGMFAASFPVGSICGAATQLDSHWLALLIGTTTILLLGTVLTAAALDRRLESRTARLVASLSAANKGLHHASRHDPLTDLGNRNLLTERIDSALQSWHAEQRQFAVLYVDIDGFKIINDQLGHSAGDQLLVQAARALQSLVRHGDTVARIGGDEFVLLIRDTADAGAVARVCDKILRAVHSIGHGAIQLSASIGSARCPADATDPSDLITAADIAMYAAKNRGKRCFLAYSKDMAAGISRDYEIQQELQKALNNGDLCVYYQPKFATSDRRLTGAEALVRWPHATRGMIAPDQFIGIAERCGLIHELESYVLESVCAQIRMWLDQGLQVPPISVNLSAVRIRDESMPTRTQACLDKHRVASRYLMFEITETVAVQEILRAIETLKNLSAMGVQVALDDFGTGHSSLSYLKQLPIQQLKIDRSFVKDLCPTTNSDHVEIVRSIISLAHALRLSVIAEGVETEEQMAFLGDLDCDEVQGFLLGRPVPAAAFAAVVVAHAGWVDAAVEAQSTPLVSS